MAVSHVALLCLDVARLNALLSAGTRTLSWMCIDRRESSATLVEYYGMGACPCDRKQRTCVQVRDGWAYNTRLTAQCRSTPRKTESLLPGKPENKETVEWQREIRCIFCAGHKHLPVPSRAAGHEYGLYDIIY